MVVFGAQAKTIGQWSCLVVPYFQRTVAGTSFFVFIMGKENCLKTEEVPADNRIVRPLLG